ncbi:hypothetical protein GCM10008986_29940 [Salinibacillus aidingensis]|uniref:Uncharacterized protein n=1 Tax=Salinibacillus aidingensis TaxID=237684 RepID=A0ABN1BNM5_9BACI
MSDAKNLSKNEIVIRMFVNAYTEDEIANVTGHSIEQVQQQLSYFQTGEITRSFDIASNMLRKGFEKEVISEITELEVKLINELRHEMIRRGDFPEERK